MQTTASEHCDLIRLQAAAARRGRDEGAEEVGRARVELKTCTEALEARLTTCMEEGAAWRMALDEERTRFAEQILAARDEAHHLRDERDEAHKLWEEARDEAHHMRDERDEAHNKWERVRDEAHKLRKESDRTHNMWEEVRNEAHELRDEVHHLRVERDAAKQEFTTSTGALEARLATCTDEREAMRAKMESISTLLQTAVEGTQV